jgi:endonuclease/exonuclease/phosphatase family metal-dependent hydrolase
VRRDLHVLSWNLHDLPWFLSPHHAERLKRVTARLIELSPDIATFQEVWLEEDARPMIVALKARGYDAVESPDRLGMKDGGLLTFVRRGSGWAISVTRRQEFWDSAPAIKIWEGDGVAHKGFQLTTLRHRDYGDLVVVNTHLQAQYGNAYESVRRHQLEQLLKGAGAQAGGGVPVLVCGDFNTDASEPLHELFADDPWIDLTEPYRRRCTCKTSFSDRDTLNAWIDYIVARRDPCLSFAADIELQTNLHKDDPYSDHEGLFATVVIEDVDQASLFFGLAMLAAVRGPSTRRRALRHMAAIVLGYCGDL